MMILLLFVCTLFLSGDEPYVVVLTNSKTLKVKAVPSFEGNRCVVTLLNGEKTSIPAAMVDIQQTEFLNHRMMEVREATARATVEAETEAADAASGTEPPPETPVIVLRNAKDLPESRPVNSVTGFDQPVSDDDPADAPPEERTFTSEDPVYLSRERIVKLRQGYRIECELGVNEPTGAQNVTLALRVQFASQPPGEYTANVDAPRLAFGETARVSFRIPIEDRIMQTSYQVSGDLIVPP